MRRPEQCKKFSSNSNFDLDLIPIMLKHKLIKDVAIPKICMVISKSGHKGKHRTANNIFLRTVTFTLALALES